MCFFCVYPGNPVQGKISGRLIPNEREFVIEMYDLMITCKTLLAISLASFTWRHSKAVKCLMFCMVTYCICIIRADLYSAFLA